MQVATEIYSCKPPTRVVVPFVGDLSSNRFLLATSNITDDNEVWHVFSLFIDRYTLLSITPGRKTSIQSASINIMGRFSD